MDIKQEILLGSEKNINSVNVDNYTKVELFNNQSRITEFTVNDVVNSTEVFDAEREANQVYRIYGRIEWMSLLNGLKNGDRELEDFFNPQYTGDSKNLINSFDFYLVAPHSGDTYNTISGTNHRRRSFYVLTEKEDFEIYNAGFTNNVYGEQVYSFNFKVDFDVSEYYDKLGFPLTELFLYAQYRPFGTEEMSRINFSTNGNKTKVSLTTKDLHVGDDVENYQGGNITDIIEYNESDYFQALVEEEIFYIRTKYGSNSWLEWKYNPFIPFRLRYLDGVLSTAPLPEIVGSASTFTAQIQNTSSSKLTATKALKQSIDTTTRTINKWDNQSTSTFDWDYNSGILTITIPAAFTYEFTFQTQIRLSYNTDKYIAETYIEEMTSGSSDWEEVPNTRRKYRLNSPIQKASFSKQYIYGDQIRMRVRLIPNPDERKVFRIPDYAKMIISDGKYVWRDILPQGYVDPITNEGVDYPFFNKKRYLFEAIVFNTPPNLTTDPDFKHQNTLDVFEEIEYYQDATSIDLTPQTQDDLDNIGKPCQ